MNNLIQADAHTPALYTSLLFSLICFNINYEEERNIDQNYRIFTINQKQLKIILRMTLKVKFLYLLSIVSLFLFYNILSKNMIFSALIHCYKIFPIVLLYIVIINDFNKL